MLTMATQQTPAEILSWITDALASNKTIYVATATRITKITPKVAQQFDAAGRPVFRASDKSLYMSVGRRYDCIDYCRITARSI
jgi:hypothetical protein